MALTRFGEKVGEETFTFSIGDESVYLTTIDSRPESLTIHGKGHQGFKKVHEGWLNFISSTECILVSARDDVRGDPDWTLESLRMLQIHFSTLNVSGGLVLDSENNPTWFFPNSSEPIRIVDGRFSFQNYLFAVRIEDYILEIVHQGEGVRSKRNPDVVQFTLPQGLRYKLTSIEA